MLLSLLAHVAMLGNYGVTRRFAVLVVCLYAARAASNDDTPLSNLTRSLVHQNASIAAQSIRIPASFFSKHACSVVYLASPDWARVSASVGFPATAGSSTCQRFFLSYVDGYNVPSSLAPVSSFAGDAPWGAAQYARVATAAERRGDARRRRALLPGVVVGGLNFQSTYDRVQEQKQATQELLQRGSQFVPGPEGPLERPVLASRRKNAGVASVAVYEPGALPQRTAQHAVADGGSDSGTGGSAAAPELSYTTDGVRVYWAPETDCLDALRRQERMGENVYTPAAQTAEQPWARAGPATYESCFVTQVVLYIFNNCPAANTTTAQEEGPSAPDTPVDGAEGPSSPAAAQPPPPPTTTSPVRGVDQSILDALDAAVAQQSYLLGAQASDAWVEVTVLYEPYLRCSRRGAHDLAGFSIQVILFTTLVFGWLLVIIMVPALCRLMVDYPVRLVLSWTSGCCGEKDQSKKLKPLTPGLHAGEARLHLVQHLPWLRPFFRWRKHLVYAVTTVHSADGQSRWLQVCIISLVGLSITVAVYSPKVHPPLDHFEPQQALQIVRSSTNLSVLQYFFDIVLFSSFMGVLGYLSMLANYNRSTNQYYRWQVAVSCFFMVILDLLLLLQLISILVQWPNMDSPGPYIAPMTFQFINLLAANILQGIIFTRRHEQANREIYTAYMQALQERQDVERQEQAHATMQRASRRAASAVRTKQQAALAAETVEDHGPGGVDASGYVNFRRHRGQVQNPLFAQGTARKANGAGTPCPPSSPDRLRQQVAAGGRSMKGHAAAARDSELAVMDVSATNGGGDDGVEATEAAPPLRPRSRRLLQQAAGPGPGPVAEGRLGLGRGSDSATDGSDAAPLQRDHVVLAGAVRVSTRRAGSRPALHQAGGEAQEATEGAAPDPQGRRGAFGSAVGTGQQAAGGDGSTASGRGGDGGLGPKQDKEWQEPAAEVPATAGRRLYEASSEEDLPYHLRPYRTTAQERPSMTRSRAAAAASKRTSQYGAAADDNAAARDSNASRRSKPHLSETWEERLPWPLAWVAWVVKSFVRVFQAVREGEHFRYPAWLLAALLVSGYILILHFGFALNWSHNVADCIESPSECLSAKISKYVRFASRMFSRTQQLRLLGTLNDLLGLKPQVEEQLAAQAASAAASVPNSSTLAAGLVSGINMTQLVADAMAAAGGGQQVDPYAELPWGGSVQGLSGALAAQLQQSLQDKATQTLGLLVPVAQAAEVKSQALLNATVETLFSAVNATATFLGRAVQLQDDAKAWQSALRNRFAWSSVLGFTLGLQLGFSTLLQTAISFKRAVRRARLLRAVKTLLEGGAGPGAGEANARLRALSEDQLLVTRSLETSISLVVFFFGVLVSTAVIQLYLVGVVLSVLLAFITHPWTWSTFMPAYWQYILAIIGVIVLNKYVLIGYVGDVFLSDGNHIYRPAAWLAFTFIMSITNIMIGLLLALYRILLLLATTVLALGKLEATIFTYFAFLDLPHASFLAGLHMHVVAWELETMPYALCFFRCYCLTWAQQSMKNFHDPIYLPGPRGRAHRRWRKLRDTVREIPAEELRLLATLGRPKEVQDCLDHVVINMNGSRAAPAQAQAGGSTRTGGAAGGGAGALDSVRRPVPSRMSRPGLPSEVADAAAAPSRPSGGPPPSRVKGSGRAARSSPDDDDSESDGTPFGARRLQMHIEYSDTADDDAGGLPPPPHGDNKGKDVKRRSGGEAAPPTASFRRRPAAPVASAASVAAVAAPAAATLGPQEQQDPPQLRRAPSGRRPPSNFRRQPSAAAAGGHNDSAGDEDEAVTKGTATGHGRRDDAVQPEEPTRSAAHAPNPAASPGDSTISTARTPSKVQRRPSRRVRNYLAEEQDEEDEGGDAGWAGAPPDLKRQPGPWDGGVQREHGGGEAAEQPALQGSAAMGGRWAAAAEEAHGEVEKEEAGATGGVIGTTMKAVARWRAKGSDRARRAAVDAEAAPAAEPEEEEWPTTTTVVAKQRSGRDPDSGPPPIPPSTSTSRPHRRLL